MSGFEAALGLLAIAGMIAILFKIGRGTVTEEELLNFTEWLGEKGCLSKEFNQSKMVIRYMEEEL